MPINVETFLALPDLVYQLNKQTKEDLSTLALHFEIDVSNKRKDEIKSLLRKQFIQEGLLEPDSEMDEDESKKEDDISASLKMQIEMKKLELQRELELRKLEFERENREMERQQKMEERLIEKQRMEMQERIEMEKLRTQQISPQQQHGNDRFDPARNIRLVPKFIERSVEK